MLTDDMKANILKEVESGEKKIAIANRYGVSRQVIYDLVKKTKDPNNVRYRRKVWKAVDTISGQAKLTSTQVFVIRYLHDNLGYGNSELAYLFNVSDTTIKRAIDRDTWQHVPDTIEQAKIQTNLKEYESDIILDFVTEFNRMSKFVDRIKKIYKLEDK